MAIRLRRAIPLLFFPRKPTPLNRKSLHQATPFGNRNGLGQHYPLNPAALSAALRAATCFVSGFANFAFLGAIATKQRNFENSLLEVEVASIEPNAIVMMPVRFFLPAEPVYCFSTNQQQQSIMQCKVR